MREETRLESFACPHCGYVCDACLSVKNEDARPKEGSISLCINCGEFAMFNADLTLREFTDEEETEIMTDPGIKETRAAWVRMDAERQQRQKKAH